jgi:1-acyl-sn-glycerol-3-phosphate acyltransferase
MTGMLNDEAARRPTGGAESPNERTTRDLSFLEALLPWMQRYSDYFDAEIRGFENVPTGGVLLVGNHSGGTVVPDTAALINGWYNEFGMDRPLVGLAHDAMFSLAPLADFMRKLGEIPATPANATLALEEGCSVLVYPGGAYDAFRPWTRRNEIELAGHKGFIRLALRTGVPVVPVVAHGGHNSTIVLTRGDAIAKRSGAAELGMPVAPLLWQFPWGISIPLLIGVPMPSKITIQLLPAMAWEAYGPEDADDDAVLDRCYEEMRAQMQECLTSLVEEVPYPVVRRVLDFVRRRISG